VQILSYAQEMIVLTADLRPNAPAEWPHLEDPTLLDRIIDIVAQEGDIDRALIVPEATLDTLGIASMEVVMILMGIEEKLNVYIPIETDLSTAKNLAELITAITSAMTAAPGQAADAQA